MVGPEDGSQGRERSASERSLLRLNISRRVRKGVLPRCALGRVPRRVDEASLGEPAGEEDKVFLGLDEIAGAQDVGADEGDVVDAEGKFPPAQRAPGGAGEGGVEGVAEFEVGLFGPGVEGVGEGEAGGRGDGGGGGQRGWGALDGGEGAG